MKKPGWKITITNDFHSTEATMIVRNGRLSTSQIRRAKKKLCGIADCTCSNFLGQRGPQPEPYPDQPELALMIEERGDGTADVWAENPHG